MEQDTSEIERLKSELSQLKEQKLSGTLDGLKSNIEDLERRLRAAELNIAVTRRRERCGLYVQRKVDWRGFHLIHLFKRFRGAPPKNRDTSK